MPAIDASELLRPGLLEGLSVVLAVAEPQDTNADASFGAAVHAACIGLGASVYECALSFRVADGGDAIEREVRSATQSLLADAGGVELLVIDCASAFVGAGGHERGSARESLRTCLDLAWNVTHTVVNSAFLPSERGGRIVYLAPPADAGEHADAARTGLENLVRTLSIEWARHGVTTIAIAPGAAMAEEVAALTAYLASPAGAYFSGCLFDLPGVSPVSHLAAG
jgi:NAD(P)-dependent dehydrogenase (short-subunit alcohol dehydrogenase family)